MVIQTFGFVGNADKPAFVRIELRIERGFLFRVSGVAYSSAKSLQARVRSALLSCNYRWPGKAITINISPSIEARCTPQLDLPIAIAILASEIPRAPLESPELRELPKLLPETSQDIVWGIALV